MGGSPVSDFRWGYPVSDFRGEVKGVPGLRFLGGFPVSDFFKGGGTQSQIFRGVPGLNWGFLGGWGVPGLRFLGGGTRSQ